MCNFGFQHLAILLRWPYILILGGALDGGCAVTTMFAGKVVKPYCTLYLSSLAHIYCMAHSIHPVPKLFVVQNKYVRMMMTQRMTLLQAAGK